MQVGVLVGLGELGGSFFQSEYECHMQPELGFGAEDIQSSDTTRMTKGKRVRLKDRDASVTGNTESLFFSTYLMCAIMPKCRST